MGEYDEYEGIDNDGYRPLVIEMNDEYDEENCISPWYDFDGE